MTSKRTKQRQNAKIEAAGENMRWVERVLEACLPELRLLTPPVEATRHFGPFSGEPSDFSVWLIFATRKAHAEAVESDVVDVVRRKALTELRASGYTPEALATFTFFATSREEIDDAGGDFAFFR